MRRSGKTTRLADEAIQAIFKPEHNGRIIIPDLFNNFNPLYEGFVQDQIFVDSEGTNESQRHLREIVFMRLKHEHSHLLVTEAGRGEICIIPQAFKK